MINVHFLGFNQPFIKSISISMANRAASICRVSSNINSDVMVVDVDNFKDLDKLDGKESKVIAISSFAFSDKKYRFLVPKPIVFTQLVKFIQNIANENSVKQSPLESKVSSSSVEWKTINPDQYLLGKLKQNLLKESFTPILYSWSLEHWIVVDKKYNRVYMGLQLATLKNLVFQTLDKHDVQIKPLSGEEVTRFSEFAIATMDLEMFLWKLTNFTLRGTLLDPLKMNKKYTLKYFPNIIQYANTTEEIAMASYLSTTSANIVEMANILNISMAKVILFVSCCYSCNLLVAGSDLTTVKKEPKKNSFISMILNKLGL